MPGMDVSRPVFFDDALSRELTLEGLVWDSRDQSASPRAFEGSYGGIYNSVIQSERLRRILFSLWGSTDPLHHLDEFVADAMRHARALAPRPVVLDLPCGGGTLFQRIHGSGVDASVVAIDLASAMLARAVALREAVVPLLHVTFVRGDATALPLARDSVDVVLSVNGLHVMPDASAFLSEIARVLRPGGGLWMITPVTGGSLRSRAILAAARRLSVTSIPPPTLVQLDRLLDDASLAVERRYGGKNITGMACVKREGAT